MARKNEQPASQIPQNQAMPQGITRITIGNFKSITGEQSIDIRPLTILAGANSSGKTSIMQPLLLLKQTLEAPYNPGPLLLDGPNVNFSEADQLLTRALAGDAIDTFSVGITPGENQGIATFLKKGEDGLFEVEKTIHREGLSEYCVRSDMSQEELNQEIFSHLERLVSAVNTRARETLAAIEAQSPAAKRAIENVEDLKRTLEGMKEVLDDFKKTFIELRESTNYPFSLVQNRCFLDFSEKARSVADTSNIPISAQGQITNHLHRMLHLPGLRGNPQRTYPIIPLGPNFTNFSGTFEDYTASVIFDWQKKSQQKTLAQLNQDLERLGLTNKITARQVTGAHVELMVNRLFHNQDGAEDMINIVDVGFGVSQAVPVVVALHTAQPGQLVYIEQPEIHLHPRAQTALAEILADAALQKKHIVIETHSDLVLSGIQTLVAEGKLPPELVKLHWFEQGSDGFTKITSADLDKAGAFGDWPEDFHKVILAAENRYLNAAETHLLEE